MKISLPLQLFVCDRFQRQIGTNGQTHDNTQVTHTAQLPQSASTKKDFMHSDQEDVKY